MSLRYVLLGLLSENPGHGYGLRKLILHRLAHFRKINEGQLYTELAKMEKEGLTEHEVQVPEKGPARKLIHITPRGREAFQAWLDSDQYEEEGGLYDFMQGYPFFTKCTFFNHLDTGKTLEKIDRQLSLLGKKKKAYREILAGMRERGADSFRIRILKFGLEEIDHRIRWMKQMKNDPAPEKKGAGGK